jgi:hypothetical protein
MLVPDWYSNQRGFALKITMHPGNGDEQSATVTYSRETDDPSGALAALIDSGRLGVLLHELGNQQSLGHLPESAADMTAALHVA